MSNLIPRLKELQVDLKEKRNELFEKIIKNHNKTEEVSFVAHLLRTLKVQEENMLKEAIQIAEEEMQKVNKTLKETGDNLLDETMWAIKLEEKLDELKQKHKEEMQKLEDDLRTDLLKADSIEVDNKFWVSDNQIFKILDNRFHPQNQDDSHQKELNEVVEDRRLLTDKTADTPQGSNSQADAIGCGEEYWGQIGSYEGFIKCSKGKLCPSCKQKQADKEVQE